MANIQSARKRIRQSAKRTEKNRIYKAKVKGLKKSYLSNLSGATKANPASIDLAQVTASIQRIAAKGILHKNKAANLISKLARRKAQAATTPKA